jgi:hypothetical protein
LLDFVRPEEHVARWWTRWLHSSQNLRSNLDSRILILLEQAGFVNSRKVAAGALFFGLWSIAYYQASAPAAD